MKKILKKIISVCISLMIPIGLIGTLPTVSAASVSYYVDSVSGSDSNSGTSTSSAWQTLAKVSSITFEPGEKILFKKGCTWTGHLRINGSGNSTAQIEVGSYGSGSNPIIDGAGQLSTLKIFCEEYITIQNIDIKNTGTSTTDYFQGILIEVTNDAPAVLHNIIIRNVNIYDIRGLRNSYMLGAGIHVKFQRGMVSPFPKIDGLTIENNNIHDVQGSGIVMDNANYDNEPAKWSTNVIVRNNVINRTGNNGCVIGYCKAPVVQNNIVSNAGVLNYEGGVAGLWSFNCEDAIFQFNEVYGTKRFTADGSAFDTDWGSSGTMIHQYNYSHDNEGGFKIGPFDGTQYPSPNLVSDISRYNISQNDKNWGSTIEVGSGKSLVYNNTFYAGIYRAKVLARNTTAGNKVYNNIFVGNEGSVYDDACEYDYNCYYNAYCGNSNSGPATDLHKVTADPLFANPGTGGYGINTLTGYKLSNWSPCLGAGRVIANNGGRDYFGNNLYAGNPEIGAYERPNNEVSIFKNPYPAPATNPTHMVYEAENLIFGNAATVGQRTAASGGSVVGQLNNPTAYVKAAYVNGGTNGGVFALIIRYSGDATTKDLYVNGTKLTKLYFSATGGFNVFADKTVSVYLNAGTDNTIMIQNDGSGSGVEVDYLELISDPQSFEAENATIAGGAMICYNSNASGSKSVGALNIRDASVEFNNVSGGESGGTYLLTIRYSAGTTATSKGLFVNGTKVETTNYAYTGGYNTFADQTTTIALSGGNNSIKIINDGGTAGANIDMITLTFVSLLSQQFEAETGILSNGAVFSYSGTASGGICIGSLHIANSSVQINNVIGTAGDTYTLSIRYGCSSAITKGLFVNGTKVETTSFPSTGAYSTFLEKTATITLSAEMNTIMIKNDGATGGINIDKFIITKN